MSQNCPFSGQRQLTFTHLFISVIRPGWVEIGAPPIPSNVPWNHVFTCSSFCLTEYFQTIARLSERDNKRQIMWSFEECVQISNSVVSLNHPGASNTSFLGTFLSSWSSDRPGKTNTSCTPWKSSSALRSIRSMALSKSAAQSFTCRAQCFS